MDKNNKKILIVDDNNEIIRGFSRLLCHKYDIDGVDNGMDALSKLKNSDYHIIISDYKWMLRHPFIIRNGSRGNESGLPVQVSCKTL